jgi:hypothetical protein
MNNVTTHPSLFFITSDYQGSYNATQCSLSTTCVDASVTCISRGSEGKPNCGVDAIRKTPNPPTLPGFSILDQYVPYNCNSPAINCSDSKTWPWRGSATASNCVGAFITTLAENAADGASVSLLTQYLYDPLGAFTAGDRLPDPPMPNIELVERRLLLLFNTFWKAGWVYASAISGNLTASVASSLYDVSSHGYSNADVDLINTTGITTFPIEPMYALDLPWITLYFISVAVMFAAAVFSLVMHHLCHAPQILGFVSSLTRDSRYFEMMHGNSSEDGAKTAKRLRALKFRVEDVHAGADVGKIAFAPAQDGLRVRRGRWYE